jgi:hypothetical protein
MNTQKQIAGIPVRSTSFNRLGYVNLGKSLWRIVDLTDSPACVGPMYKTKIELLCDLNRYATQTFGA